MADLLKLDNWVFDPIYPQEEVTPTEFCQTQWSLSQALKDEGIFSEIDFSNFSPLTILQVKLDTIQR